MEHAHQQQQDLEDHALLGSSPTPHSAAVSVLFAGQLPPELPGVTPTGPALWRNFETRRTSAVWYMQTYYEHLDEIDIDEPIQSREAAIDAAVPGSAQRRSLNKVKICADMVIRDLSLMEEQLDYIRDVKRNSPQPGKTFTVGRVAAVASLATVATCTALLPAKIAGWIAFSSVGVAVTSVVMGEALWPGDLVKHYKMIQSRLRSFRMALEQCNDNEIKKQQHVLQPKTFAHLRSDLMYRWPKPDEVGQ